ncbi:MAG: hypothetical protein ABUT39_09350 [Acidobacteriota bacterium]
MSETRNVSFVDLCRRGEAVPEQIDDFVDLWHEGASELSLHDFLGMTWEEYSAWVANPGLLPRIIAAHREARAS